MVKPICSERIPLENIRFKIGIFIDWEVVRLPPPPDGGAGERGALWYWMVKHIITIDGVVGVVGVGFMVWMVRYFVSPYGTSQFMSKTPFALETFETRNAQYPKTGL